METLMRKTETESGDHTNNRDGCCGCSYFKDDTVGSRDGREGAEWSEYDMFERLHNLALQ